MFHSVSGKKNTIYIWTNHAGNQDVVSKRE